MDWCSWEILTRKPENHVFVETCFDHQITGFRVEFCLKLYPMIGEVAKYVTYYIYVG